MAADPINRNPALEPPGIAGGAPAGHVRQAPKPLNGPAFDQVLRTELERAGGVRFSGHALQRLERRGIEVDQAMTDRLNAGVDRAAAKGSRDALVLVERDGVRRLGRQPHRHHRSRPRLDEGAGLYQHRQRRHLVGARPTPTPHAAAGPRSGKQRRQTETRNPR